MAMTLAQIKLMCRQRTNEEDSFYVSDQELTSYVNGSATELNDLMIINGEQYFISELPFVLASDADRITLPADFYKLQGVDFSTDGNIWYTLKQWNWQERNVYTFQGLTGWNFGYLRYRVVGNELVIVPQNSAGGSYRLFYTKRFTPLVLDTETLDGINGWEEYVVADVCAKIMIKNMFDPSPFFKQKAEMKERIEAMARARDYGQPERITDIESDNSWDPFWQGGY